MMVEETVWEDHETCDHSYDKRCHKSYTTTYNAVQEEECDEKFRKICYIEMVDVATNVTTEVCRRPLVKDCTTEGETICRTEYESECWNKQIPHEVSLKFGHGPTKHQHNKYFLIISLQKLT